MHAAAAPRRPAAPPAVRVRGPSLIAPQIHIHCAPDRTGGGEACLTRHAPCSVLQVARRQIKIFEFETKVINTQWVLKYSWSPLSGPDR